MHIPSWTVWVLAESIMLLGVVIIIIGHRESKKKKS